MHVGLRNTVMKPGPRSWVVRYAGAVAAAALGAGMRLLLDQWLGASFPFPTIFLAVLLVTWYAGGGPGFVAMATGALLAAQFVLPRTGSHVPGGDNQTAMVLYLVVTTSVVVLGGAMHAAQARSRALADDAIRQREQLRTTLASIGDAVLVTDADANVTTLNPVAQRLTGWMQADAIGRPLEEVFCVFDEETHQRRESPAVRVLREGGIVGMTSGTVLRSRDGAERPIDDSAAPIRDAAGRVSGVVLVFRDVGERRRVEQTSRTLAAIVESSEDAIFSKTLDGVIMSWNPAAERLYGYAAAEMIGRPVGVLVPSDRAAELDEIMDKVRRGEPTNPIRTARVRKDGHVVDVSVAVSPVRDRSGRVVGASSIARDIGVQKQAERQLQAIVDNVAALVFVKDREGRFLVANRHLEHVLGRPRSEIVGNTNRAFFPREIAESFVAHDRQVMETGQPLRFEETVPQVDGPHTYLSLKFPLREPDGTIYGVCCVATDISERKDLETRLRRNADELAEADRRKDEFLATLAHELRNPLAPIRNALAIMRLAPGESDREMARQIVDRQVEQMVHLVDDLLDVSRITRGKIELRKQRLEMRTILDRAIEASRPLLASAEHELVVKLPEEPVFVEADLTRMAQVVGNLLNNAAKYTNARGRIEVTILQEGHEAIIRVRDNGIGIPAEMLPLVFDMFTQVDASRGRAHGGLGIGLTLVKRLVELHGGTVWARSEGAGTGSEFTVRLPLSERPATEERRRPAATVAASPCQDILVVDDNRDAAATMGLLLRTMGHRVAVVHDGPAALQSVAARCPDIVFLDLGMPGMDGFEVARRIRARSDGRSIVVVAVTGWGQEDDRRRTREAGFDHHLVKPVDPLDLQRTMGRRNGHG